MRFEDLPIQKKLMRAIVLISIVVLLVACTTFFVYEFYSFRQRTIEQLSTIGKIISSNSTAALAFDNREDAKEILTSLRAEPHIVAACLYDKDGNLFSYYPANLDAHAFVTEPELEGYHFEDSHLEGLQPVIQETKQLGTLYLKSDLGAMYERFELYGIITSLVIAASFLLAYFFSRALQKSISKPILALAETANVISTQHDYSIRAIKLSKDEVGSLTDAFNLMVEQIQQQNKALAEFNQKLEQKVQERTNDLEIANKELESFTYSVSHDLRAPLRGIHSYTKILEEDYMDKLSSDGQKTIEVILRNSKRMGELIDDLLAFSRLGKKEIYSQDIHMKSLVKFVVDEFLLSPGQRTCEINIKSLLPASGDQALVKQVWVNLISNAIKYSGKKPQTIIEIGSYTEESYNVYYVKDNGIGFDMRYYDKLFGVFQRLHSQEEFEGTGVGLAITHRIILKHHGKIWAESKVNEGTTFYFTLPPIQP